MDNHSSSSNSWNDERMKRDYHQSMSMESNSSDKVSDMSPMLNRLASFQTWPDDVVTSATELTRCGFFYTGFKDEVRCCVCGVKLQNWKMNDEPYQRHKAASPGCKFLLKIENLNNRNGANNYSDEENSNIKSLVNGNETKRHHTYNSRQSILTENIPYGPRPPSTTPPRHRVLHEENSQQNNRRETGNYPPPVNQSPIKSKNDVLNVMSREDTAHINDWITQRPTENGPLTNNSEVDFTLEANRLATFVYNWPSDPPLTPAELVDAGFYFTGPGDRVQCAWCGGGLYNFEAGDTAIGEHIRHFPECPFIKKKMSQMVGRPNLPVVNQQQRNTTTPPTLTQPIDVSQLTVVKIAQQMGYTLTMIKKALTKIDSPATNVTSEQLIDVLFDLEDTAEDDNESQSEGATGGMETKPPNDKKSSLFEHAETSSEKHELVEENERLKGKTVCKICLDKPVETLFLPCRHLVCCEECADAVQQCPVCRNVIVGTVKAFLS